MMQATGEVCERMNGIQKCIVFTTLDNGVPGEATGPVQRPFGRADGEADGRWRVWHAPSRRWSGGPGRLREG